MAVPATDNSFYDWQKLTLVLTNICDLKCKMCSIIRRPIQSLSKEHAFHAADFAEQRGFTEIELTGGEPTLAKYFWELMDRLSTIDTTIKLTTNGVRMTEEQVAQLAQMKNLQVAISIDGLDELHDDIRMKEGAFDAAFRTMERLCAAGCDVGCNTVVQGENFRQMVEVYERFKPLPLRYHAFCLVEDNTDDTQLIKHDEMDEFTGVMKEIENRAEKDDRWVNLSDDLLYAYRRQVLQPTHMIHPGRGCTVVKKGLIITQDATVIPCWHYPLWDAEEKRNLNNRTLDEIVDDPAVHAEIENAIGGHGCEGCSSMCYNWDKDFQDKTLHPTAMMRLQHMAFDSKEYLRQNHPAAFNIAKKVRALTGSGR
jgi:MoaA/NifB/PqqE/SkfB family radical SAM enzyme